MSSDAQLSMEERPQPGKLRSPARRRLRFIVPLMGAVVCLWIASRLDASETASHLNSFSDRLRFVAPSLACFSLAMFFFLWSVLAVGSKEPRWAAAIANFGMEDLPERRKVWSLRAYLAPLGYIAAGAISFSTRAAIFWPSHAKLVPQLALIVSFFFVFVVLGVFSGWGKMPPSGSGIQQGIISGRKD